MLDAHEARLADAVGDVAAAFAADTTAAIAASRPTPVRRGGQRVEAMREAAGLARRRGPVSAASTGLFV